MNLPTKLAYNPLFADKLANFADKILLHGQKRIFLRHDIFPGGGGCQQRPCWKEVEK